MPERINVMLSTEQIATRVRELGAEISRDYAGSNLALVCVLKGSFIFAADLCRAIDLPSCRVDFLGVRSYGEGTESSGVVQITHDLSHPIEGEDVLVVEDIVDTGLTLAHLLDLLRTRKPRSVRICSLLHKPSRARVSIKIDYLGFTIEDHFVVGYGLDFAERYRNVPFVGVVERGLLAGRSGHLPRGMTLMARRTDVILVGAGHNGLVAATLLARAGLDVLVLEAASDVGGAVKTERPFARAPELGTSTGAYLLGLMPPELVDLLGVAIPTLRRDPHYFLPTTSNKYLLFGSDAAQMREQFLAFFSEGDWRAYEAMQAELAMLRDDVGPTWLREPLSIEDTAARFVRPALRRAFIDLCRQPVGRYLERFDFKSDLVKAMFAVTDGFSGLYGAYDTPGTGMNFLIHNMCRLPGADGTWMVVKGGMGTLAHLLADAARAAGARIETGKRVTSIVVENGAAVGVALENGEEVRARVVVSNADPFRMASLVGLDRLPSEYRARLDAWKKPGSTMKVNLALSGLPRFTCLPEDRGQHGATMHLLPDEADVMRVMREGFADVEAGKLPSFPTIEWYIHTTIDPSLRDAKGRHNSALFVQWVPYEIAGSSWDAEEDRYVKHLLSICDRFAPGTSALVDDVFPLHPQKIERHFGISYGHIHHVDNAFGFADRVPYRAPIAGLYSASAGCHPAGSVIGAAGHNAAAAVLRDMSLPTAGMIVGG